MSISQAEDSKAAYPQCQADLLPGSAWGCEFQHFSPYTKANFGMFFGFGVCSFLLLLVVFYFLNSGMAECDIIPEEMVRRVNPRLKNRGYGQVTYEERSPLDV